MQRQFARFLGHAVDRWLAGALVLASLITLVPLIDRFTPPRVRLERVAAQLQAEFLESRDRLGSLARQFADPPENSPFKGDWVDLNRYGQRAGVALYRRDTSHPERWLGWTSELRPEEAGTLLKTPPGQMRAAVIRRGLEPRLALSFGVTDSVAIAEAELPNDDRHGLFSTSLPSDLRLRLRWRSGVPSLAPLKESSESLARVELLLTDAQGEWLGRGALLALPDDPMLASRLRRAGLLVGLALTLILWRRRFAPFLVGTSLVAIAVAASGAAAPRMVAGVWSCLIAATLPLEGKRSRQFAHAIALLAIVGAWIECARFALQHQTAPGDLLVGGDRFGSRIAMALSLQLPAIAGAWLMSRAALNRRRWGISLVALVGFGAGLAHDFSHRAGVRAAVEQGLEAEISHRESRWTEIAGSALDLALAGEAGGGPPPAAIDLWWRSSLSDSGIACGIWRVDADGKIADHFLTGLPPQPAPPRGDHDRLRHGELFMLQLPYRVATMERDRPEGGRWVVSILDEPANVPSRQLHDPLRGMKLERRHHQSPLSDLLRAPSLAWFDPAGRLVRSERDDGPPAPASHLQAANWRLDPTSSGWWLREFPDKVGFVTISVPIPDTMARAAQVASWMVLAVLTAMLLFGLLLLLDQPLQFWGALRRLWLAQFRRFQFQLSLTLIAAGLIPLVALGLATRAVARSQAEARLKNEAVRTATFASRLVHDFLALRGDSSEQLDPVATAWLARTVGDDLFLWDEGRLGATSRSDLIDAGIWPERVSGELWQRLGERSGTPILERNWRGAGLERQETLAHGLYRRPDDRPGAVSVRLSVAQERAEESLIETDRALFLAAVMLFGVALAFSLPAARRLHAPLSKLTEATRRIAGGQFDAALPERGGFEETRQLAGAFDDMARALGRQQSELRVRAATIEALIASMPLAVLVLKRDGQVALANPPAQSLLGARPDAPLPEGPLTAATAQAVLQPERPILFGSPAAPEGARQYRISAFGLPGIPGGDESSRLVLIEDLTDAVRAERLVAWAEMARRIAHEIKNPLTPIALMVDHLRRLQQQNSPEFPAVFERAMRSISDQVQVLRDTSREFSDYARLLTARPERIELRAELERWTEPYRLAADRGVNVELRLPPGPLELSTDPRLLRRALLNLLDNACAAARDRGSVVVTLSRRDQKVTIAIEDNGAGIEPERLQRIFEPDVTTRETGFGLGLPIVNEALQAIGARLQVGSVVGRGSKFEIELPAPDPA